MVAVVVVVHQVPLPPQPTHHHQDPTVLHNNNNNNSNKDPHHPHPTEHLEEEVQDIKKEYTTRTLAIMPLISCIYFCTSHRLFK